jgi:hypothetical protein
MVFATTHKKTCLCPNTSKLFSNLALDTVPPIIFGFNRKIHEKMKLPPTLPFFPLLSNMQTNRASLHHRRCSRKAANTIANCCCPALRQDPQAGYCNPALLQAHGGAPRPGVRRQRPLMVGWGHPPVEGDGGT